MTDLFDTAAPARPQKTTGDEFETFWAIYPRHEAKKKAREKFIAARRAFPLQTILEGAQRYAAHVQGVAPQYILHPATWLYGERWTDELVPRGPAQPLRGTDALRHQLRQEIDEQGYGGPEDFDPRLDGRFPRLTH